MHWIVRYFCVGVFWGYTYYVPWVISLKVCNSSCKLIILCAVGELNAIHMIWIWIHLPTTQFVYFWSTHSFLGGTNAVSHAIWTEKFICVQRFGLFTKRLIIVDHAIRPMPTIPTKPHESLWNATRWKRKLHSRRTMNSSTSTIHDDGDCHLDIQTKFGSRFIFWWSKMIVIAKQKRICGVADKKRIYADLFVTQQQQQQCLE